MVFIRFRRFINSRIFYRRARRQYLLDKSVLDNQFKEDSNSKKPIAILLKDNSSKIISKSESGYKLSPLGNAYREQAVPIQEPLKDSFFAQDVSIDQFKIMVPIPTSEKTFIESSHNKHLIVIFNPLDEE